MVFLKLRWEPGVFSRVKAEMAIHNSCFFGDIRTPVELRGTPQESPRGLAGQYRSF